MRVCDGHVYGGGPTGCSLWLVPMFVCTYPFTRGPVGGLVASPRSVDGVFHDRCPRSWMDIVTQPCTVCFAL